MSRLRHCYWVSACGATCACMHGSVQFVHLASGGPLSIWLSQVFLLHRGRRTVVQVCKDALVLLPSRTRCTLVLCPLVPTLSWKARCLVCVGRSGYAGFLQYHEQHGACNKKQEQAAFTAARKHQWTSTTVVQLQTAWSGKLPSSGKMSDERRYLQSHRLFTIHLWRVVLHRLNR